MRINKFIRKYYLNLSNNHPSLLSAFQNLPAFHQSLRTANRPLESLHIANTDTHFG